jgi:exosortase K
VNAAAGGRAGGGGFARRAVTIAAACLLAALLKLHHHRADLDGLRWVLEPTVRAVEVVTGAGFEREAQRGYLCRERRYEIVPACAGVNFMIVAFLCVALGLAGAGRAPGAWATLALAAAAAYLVTIVANATRIAIAMHLHEAAVAIGPLTPERLHRIAGVTVYFAYLCALYRLARAVAVRRAPAR